MDVYFTQECIKYLKNRGIGRVKKIFRGLETFHFSQDHFIYFYFSPSDNKVVFLFF